MSKKKIMLLAACVAVVVVASIIGTLAYLTSSKEVVNTFTVGNIEIDLDEAEVTTDGVPVVPENRVDGNEYHLIPGQEYTKDPTLTVKKGSEESFVRMLVTFNKKAELDAIFAPTGADLTSIFKGYDAAKWEYENSSVDGNNITYEFRYYTTVDASEATADVELEPLFTSFILPGEINGEQLKTISDLEIKVVGHAIQKQVLETEDKAWEAFDKQMNP